MFFGDLAVFSILLNFVKPIFYLFFLACHYSPLGVSAAQEKFNAWMLQWISRARYVSPYSSTIAVLNASFLLI